MKLQVSYIRQIIRYLKRIKKPPTFIFQKVNGLLYLVFIPAYNTRVQIDIDLLNLLIFLDTMNAKLSANTAHLIAAPRCFIEGGRFFNAFQIPNDLANNRNRVENDTSIEV